MTDRLSNQPGTMTYLDNLKADPTDFDLFDTLREFERGTPDKPRLGDSSVVQEDVVTLGQDPFDAFPSANISRIAQTEDGRVALFVRFLGMFGPQGALPLTTTIEAQTWSRRNDPSFARFVDIFTVRFLHLFFRAWADARPVGQFDRPNMDRFINYVGSVAGFGSPAFADRDRIPDIVKLGFAGLVAPQPRSASRLRGLIRGVFGVEVDIVEHIGTWLEFEAGDETRIGASGCGLGSDAAIGQRSYSINDKFRIQIRTHSLKEYRRYLPSGDLSDALTDLIFFYIGHQFEYDVQLSLPAKYAPASQLGRSGQIGWTAWVAPDTDQPESVFLSDAVFQPMERRRVKGEQQRA
ncbi:MAG: type VI secretion system baseplate subunit TssG [Pseudomonadota bacterium]